MNQFPETKKAMKTDEKTSVIPFSLKYKTQKDQKEKITNSEMKHECWFIENPVSKDLTKRITLKLGPMAEQEFIIAVRSPVLNNDQNLASIINVGLLTYRHEDFGVSESFEEFLKYNYENSMKRFLYDRKKLASV